MVEKRETEIGADRVQLGFAEIAATEFSFLIERGFRLAETSDTLARYESEDRLVRVFHGRSSYELGVEIGRWIEVDGISREQVFPLRDIVAERKDPADIGFTGTTATSATSVRYFLSRLAMWTREFAMPLLNDGDDLFNQLSDSNAARAEAERDKLRASRLRIRADEAWRQKDLETVLLAYTEIEQELATVPLHASERARLAYAKKNGEHPHHSATGR